MTKVIVAAVAVAVATPAALAQEKPAATISWNSGAPKIAEGEKAFRVSGRIQFDVFNLETDGASTVDQSYSRAYLGVDGVRRLRR